MNLRRGASMVEAAIAAALLLATVAVVATSIATANMRRAEASSRADISGYMVDALGFVTVQGFDAVVDDSFSVPSPCGAQSTGVTATSCVVVSGVDYVIRWSTRGVAASDGSSTAYLVSATATATDGVEYSRSAAVSGGGPDTAAGKSRLFIDVRSAVGEIPAVFVVDADDFTDVIAAVPFGSSPATQSVDIDASSCTEVDKCSAVLSPAAPHHQVGRWSQTAATEPFFFSGDEYRLELAVVETATVTFHDTTGADSVTGGFCVTASGSGGSTTACNDAPGSPVVMSAWGAVGGESVGLPAMTPISVSANVLTGTATISLSGGQDASFEVSGPSSISVAEGQTPVAHDRGDNYTVTTGSLSVPQGGSGTLDVTVADGVSPAVGIPVVLSSIGSSGGDIQAVPAWCVSDADGECALNVSAAVFAKTGSRTVKVSTAEGSAISTTVTILSAPAYIRAGALSLRAGASAELTIVVTDGEGSPVAGEAVSLTGTSLSSPPQGTDSDGVATLTVTAASDAPVGPNSVVLSAGSVTRTIDIDVVPTVDAISTDFSGTAVRGELTVVDLELSGGGYAAGAARIDVTAPSGVDVTGTTTSRSDGTARIYFLAGSSSPGSFQLDVAVHGSTFGIDVVLS